METTILICFAGLIILSTIDFHLVQRRFNEISEHLNKLEKKIDELKSETNDLKKQNYE